MWLGNPHSRPEIEAHSKVKFEQSCMIGDILNATPSCHEINLKHDICKQSDSFHESFFSLFLSSLLPLPQLPFFPIIGWRRNKEVEPKTPAVYRAPRMDQGPSWWLRGEESAGQCRGHGLDPGVTKSPWRRKWQPTPVFVPGKPHGQRSLVGYSLWGRKECDTTEQLKTKTGWTKHLIFYIPLNSHKAKLSHTVWSFESLLFFRGKIEAQRA